MKGQKAKEVLFGKFDDVASSLVKPHEFSIDKHNKIITNSTAQQLNSSTAQQLNSSTAQQQKVKIKS